jgi:tetratricopeptide (TPR) repeat protein
MPLAASLPCSCLILLLAVVPSAWAQGAAPADPPAARPLIGADAGVRPQETPAQGPRERTPREEEEMRADVLFARKQFSQAAQAYEKLLAAEPRNIALMNKAGNAYLQMGLLKPAKRYYERAIKLDKTYAVGYNNLGSVYYHQKKNRQAVSYYRRAVALRPDMAVFHCNLGYAYFADKKYEQALASFQRALVIDPTILERRETAGTILQNRSVADRAAFYYYVAKSFAQIGNAERCAHYLKRARDEGYPRWSDATRDPAFAAVIDDPLVKEALAPPPPPPAQPL